MDWKALFGHRLFKLGSAAAMAASFYVLQPYRPVVFIGKSMANTYQDHEAAIGTTDISNLMVGDVVVIRYEGSTFIKRIKYLPGDKVHYTKVGDVWHITESTRMESVKHKKFPTKTVTIPEGEVYVLGDNAPVSIDSRQLGTIPIEHITTKLIDPKPIKPAPVGG